MSAAVGENRMMMITDDDTDTMRRYQHRPDRAGNEPHLCRKKAQRLRNNKLQYGAREVYACVRLSFRKVKI
jgi:hypothetical protein